MTIIDTHAHIYPDATALKAAKSTGIFLQTFPCVWTGRWPADGPWRGGGISRFLVHSVAVTPSRVHSINDYLMRVSAEHPERLIGFARCIRTTMMCPVSWTASRRAGCTA